MGKTYVVSDIHGNFDLFKKLLEKIEFSDDDKLYIVGDICDRGPDSLNIYLYIAHLKNIILLKGNHEYMMQQALSESVAHGDFDYPSNQFRLWSQNGGNTTIENFRDYLSKRKLDYQDYTVVKTVFLKMMLDYLTNLPLIKEITVNNVDYVLVHAGVDPETSLDKQEEDTMLWIRDYFYLSECDPTKTYIFGHTPVCFINKDHSFNIWHDDQFHNKFGIDGGLAVGRDKGQLNCLCLDDMKECFIRVEDL